MSNPAFDAALLLRGLRAMDAALGENYNVTSRTCIPAPVVYSAEFPATGLDFRQYQGITGIQNTWRGWMYEDGGKGELKATVHEDVEATVVEAFGILNRCDKSKDGLITTSEWESCQKGHSAEDQLFDLEYLLALDHVTGKMLVLEKNEPLNPADPNTYPELIQSKEEITSLTTELDRSREDVSLYKTLSIGLAGIIGVVALIFGIRALVKGDKTVKPSTPKPPPPNTETPPPSLDEKFNTTIDTRGKSTPRTTPVSTEPAPGPKASFSIGRNADAGGITLDVTKVSADKAKGISKNHVRIEVEGGSYFAIDTGANANHAKFKRAGGIGDISRDSNAPTELIIGDILSIGGIEKVFTGSPSDPNNPASAFIDPPSVNLSHSLVNQISPLAAAAGNGTATSSKPDDDAIRAAIVEELPSNMKADGKTVHSQFTSYIDEMVREAKKNKSLTAETLSEIARDVTYRRLLSWSQNAKTSAESRDIWKRAAEEIKAREEMYRALPKAEGAKAP